MSSIGKVQRRYSEAFQRKVVAEIENGTHTIEGARRLYDIGGTMTIPKWLTKHGRNQSMGKVVRIETSEERTKLQQSEQEKAELERALGQSQLKVMYLEAVIAEYEKREKASERKKKK